MFFHDEIKSLVKEVIPITISILRTASKWNESCMLSNGVGTLYYYLQDTYPRWGNTQSIKEVWRLRSYPLRNNGWELSLVPYWLI
jgi:hypothetical protein